MYQKSISHKENALQAQRLAVLACKKEKVKRVEAYNADPKRCKNCQGAIVYKYRTNMFCSRSCSGSFNNLNRSNPSEETKRKMSLAAQAAFARRIENGLTTKAVPVAKVCRNCQRAFDVPLKKKKVIFCSVDCDRHFKVTNPEAIANAQEQGRKNVERMMAEGKWKGWAGVGNDKRSFPEKYIEAKLSEQGFKEGVEYKFQKPEGRFMIDFAFVEAKIALEVDGKQHEYPEQKESDIRKDEFLVAEGWTVVRIKWKSIKKEATKKFVDDQWLQFLETHLSIITATQKAP